ncbi:hypothetical protein BJ165DRAFT_1409791 [Panaeolus papilionaceus]|nr:hypothetical protein BJ165DRAFT_1409791 [Panaeolus papilionaceus]
MSERPVKRARLELVKAFLDLEADDVDTSDDDQEDEKDLDIEEEEDIPDDGSHRRLQLTMQASTNSVPWDWDEFLARAKKHSQAILWESEVENIKKSRVLWEVGCRIGCEEASAFTLFQQALTLLTLARKVQSVVGRVSRPVRVFIETDERHTVEELIKGVANVNAQDIKQVSEQQLDAVLCEPLLPSIPSQSWIRIRHGGTLGRKYDGDIGLVLTDEKDFEITMIPRIKGVQAPIRWDKQREDIQNLNGRYRWGGRTYTDSGFLVVRFVKDQLRLDHHHGILPNRPELQLFHQLKELSPCALQSCLSAMDQQNLKLADKVKVISGELCNLVGEIQDLTNLDATVYISSQDCSYSVPLHQLRAYYQVGDAVAVVKGHYQGCWGWVVNVGACALDIFLHASREEISIDQLNVEYYSPELTSIRSVKTQESSLPLGSGKHIHQGKEVIVVKKHAYKGYYGTIKDVLHNEIARIELAANVKTVDLPLKNLALLSHHRYILKVITGETSLDRQAIELSNITKTDELSAPRASTPIPQDRPLDATDSTWVPDSSDTPITNSNDLLVEALAYVEKTVMLGGSQVSHPSRPFRRQLVLSWEALRQVPGVHWLMHPALQGLRLKLYDIKDNNKVLLEYKGFDTSGVVVHKRLETRVIVPAARICPVYPSQVSQLVTPMDGDDVGGGIDDDH